MHYISLIADTFKGCNNKIISINPLVCRIISDALAVYAAQVPEANQMIYHTFRIGRMDWK